MTELRSDRAEEQVTLPPPSRQVARITAEFARLQQGSVNPVRQPKLPPSVWMQQYVIMLIVVDLCSVVIATTVGYMLRFGLLGVGHRPEKYLLIGVALAIGWIVALASMSCYEVRHLSVGAEEFKRVFRACAITAGLLGCACYVTKTDVARGYVAGVLPLGALLLLFGRLVCRRAVHGRRAHGLWVHRIVAVGTVESVLRLLDVANRAPAAGLLIVGACIDDLAIGSEVAPGVTVLGTAHDSAAVAGDLEADVIALAGGGLNPSDVRELGWQLEGSGCGLVVAAGLTEVAGPRVHVSPVEGLPLMWLEQPKLTGLPRFLKRAVDLFGASLILLLTSPVFLTTAVAVKVTSAGPVYFRQNRLGMHESEFRVYKFRSMYRDSEAAREAYLAQNENDGSLFKMKVDPRVTKVGRFIRKYSIDELPQLLNVLRGEMSLVGPRPLATADSDYTGHIRRRLLVQPGMTGLWQVSGRSDLSWDDAVRLDLYYVENWSFGLDVAIILRTINAVLRGSGAY